jgi:hypothetical protein
MYIDRFATAERPYAASLERLPALTLHSGIRIERVMTRTAIQLLELIELSRNELIYPRRNA